MAAVPGIGFVAALHLILIALVKKKEWYFKSLMYFSILKHFNGIFNPPPTNLFILFVILLFLMNTLSSTKIRLFSLEKKLYLLFLLFVITSIIGSFYPAMSLIRIAIVWIFIFVVFQSIRRIGSFDLLHFTVQLTTILIIASMPLIFTGSGYLGNTGFFKGIINHSQDFALILLPLFMAYLITILSNKIPNSLFHTTVLSLGFIELILSASRAAVGAVAVTLIFYFIFKQQKKLNLKSLILGPFLLIGMILMISSNPGKFEKKISSFFLKYGDTGYVESYTDSIGGRLGLIEVAKNNVMEYPLTGVGFNVQTYYQNPIVRLNLDRLIKYIPGTDIMYSRPLEKGNLYTSVFEENGVIAGIYFLYILIYVLWLFYRSGIPYIWVPFLAMIINFLGEASLFSPSGPGNFQMIMIASFYLMALKKHQRKETP